MPDSHDRLAAMALAFTVFFAALPVTANTERFDAKTALELSQAAMGNQLTDLSFKDSRREKVSLSQFMDKPLIISLVYTGCADICPTITENLAHAVDVARDALGDDAFRVVTIGFDTRNDTPERMRMYAATRGIRAKDWHFLSADGATIDQLSASLGFTFRPSPQGFDHMTQTSVIDTGGKVYRHIYGADFDAPLLVEPLKQVIYGKHTAMTSLEGLINRVRLYCTLYDPASGTYRFDYSLFISIILGGLSMTIIGVVVGRAWWRQHRPAGPA